MNNFMADGGDGYTVFRDQCTHRSAARSTSTRSPRYLGDALPASRRRPLNRIDEGRLSHTSTVSPSRGITTPGTAAARSARVEEAVVERLHVHRDDDGDARDDLAHVVDPHHDEPALEERGAAGVHDRDARREARDRLLDGLVPDRVAGEVEVVEDEAADRGEQLGDRARSRVVRATRVITSPSQSSDVVDRTRVEAEARSASSSSGWQKTGMSRGQQLLGARVEVVSMTMRDEHRVEAADDLFGRERERRRSGSAPGCACCSIGGRAPASIEHRIDEDPPARRARGSPSRCGRE